MQKEKGIVGKALSLATIGFQALSELMAKKIPGAEMRPVRAALGVVLIETDGETHACQTMLEAETPERLGQLFAHLGRICFKKHPECCSAFFTGMLQQASAELTPELLAKIRESIEGGKKGARETSEEQADYLEYCIGRGKGASHADMAFLDPKFKPFEGRYAFDHK